MPTFEFDVGTRLAGERLDRAVARKARDLELDISNSAAKRLVEDGEVRVDGREAWKASRAVKKGWHVEVVVPDSVVAPPEPVLIDISSRVVFADDWVVAIDKPAGLPTHATHDPQRDHAREAVTRWLESHGDQPAYVGVHHRLDVDTSGVLLFARHRDANKGLADAFADRDVVKTYVAIVLADDPLPDAWEVEDHLGRDRHHSRRMRSVQSGGDYARTTFRTLESRTLESGPSMALVEATPHTGRTHQIRVHLAEHGAPIMGDETYGGSTRIRLRTIDRTMLHARRLRLPHPVTGSELTLEAELPEEMRQLARSSGLSCEEPT